MNVVVTNTDAQSGTLSGGYTYTASNPAPTVSSISPDVGNGQWRHGGNNHRHGIPGGSDGEAGRHGSDRSRGRQQHVDHCDNGSACGGSGECGRDQHGRAERNAERRIHLHGEQSGADGEFDLTRIGDSERWHSGDDHRYRIPGGRDGEAGRNGTRRES